MNSALPFLCFSCPAINVSACGRSFNCTPIMIQRPPAYRISSTVFMNSKRPSRASNRKQKPNSRISSSVDDEDAPIAIQDNTTAANAQDDLLDESEDKNFEEWSPVAEDDDDVSLEQLLLDDDEEEDKTLADGDILLNEEYEEDPADLAIDDAFDEEEGEEDEEDEDEEDGETEDEDVIDEDDELAAKADGEDFDDGMPIPTVGKRQKRTVSKTRSIPVKEVDDEENLDASEDGLDPIEEGFEPVFEIADVESDDSTSDLTAIGDESSTEDLDEQNAEDIRNAANILSESGILGLGLGEGKKDAASVSTDEELEEDGEYDFDGLFDAKDEDVDEEKEDNDDEIDGINAAEQQQERLDQEFALTSESSFGKIWELNEDTYVTITDPGQAYAYELDEDDEEDQEMSTVRRGKQGGWSGGLASYPTSSDLPEGSREWIARRSYELLAQSTPKEMFRWTKRHFSPPPAISDLYPQQERKPVPLGKQTLKLSSPDSSSQWNPDNHQEKMNPVQTTEEKQEEEEAGESDDVTTDTTASKSYAGQTSAGDDEFELDRTALDRSVTFPSSFKFKIEATGEDFRDHIQRIVENTLQREVEPLALSVEQEGKHERIEFNVTVQNSKEITDIFEALYSDERVKRSYG